MPPREKISKGFTPPFRSFSFASPFRRDKLWRRGKLSPAKGSAGFTLIELLVVIAIIGLLASIVTTALSNARIKSRDARRLSDIKQVKTGLDLYYVNGGGYPSDATYTAAYSAGQLQCSGVEILRIPQDPLYPTYQYTYTAAGQGATACGLSDARLQYTLTFRLEKDPSITYSMDHDGQFTPPLPQ